MRAVLGMGWGLILLWIGVGGTLMYRFREPIREAVWKIRLDWRLKFILFATLLALTEEAVTTTMTNLAPIFGVKVGEAYITASTNYLDVVALHSVVMFVPLFVGWALILSRYAFSPFSVFLLFGLTGTAMETNLGLKNPLEFGLWIFRLWSDGVLAGLLRAARAKDAALALVALSAGGVRAVPVHPHRASAVAGRPAFSTPPEDSLSPDWAVRLGQRGASGSRGHQHDALAGTQGVMERLVDVFERVFGGHIAERSAGLDEVPEVVNGELLMLVRVFV